MEWSAEAIVLSLRKHGENAVVAGLFTREHGRHAGYLRARPAKGGGWSGLSLDRWEVRSAPGAAAIREAAEAIACRPGVQLHREEGYDC